MATVKVFDIQGEEQGTLELNDKVFNVKLNTNVMHEVVTAFMTNRRQGTKGTKGRSDVKGTSAKPYRQKGTGRARSGSSKSPIWRGGGHTFKLVPKKYHITISKNKRHVALRSGLSSKLNEDKLIIVKDFSLEKISTKNMDVMFNNLNIFDSVLFVLPENNEIIYKSSRNIPGTQITIADDINIYSLLKSKYLLLTESAVKKIEENLK